MSVDEEPQAEDQLECGDSESGGRDASVDFKGKKRSHETHRSDRYRRDALPQRA